jgi:hypothetical protein
VSDLVPDGAQVIVEEVVDLLSQSLRAEYLVEDPIIPVAIDIEERIQPLLHCFRFSQWNLLTWPGLL